MAVFVSRNESSDRLLGGYCPRGSTLLYHPLPLSLWHPFVGNQQKWDTLRPERSGVGWKSGELPEGPVIASSLFDGFGLHLLSAL